jgi:superfamily II DNA helicase RecQ
MCDLVTNAFTVAGTVARKATLLIGAIIVSCFARRPSVLFDVLRTLCKKLADEQGLPPYVIFHDATLREMAQQRPATLHEFARIRGIGEAKLARYGARFIEAIRSAAIS